MRRMSAVWDIAAIVAATPGGGRAGTRWHAPGLTRRHSSHCLYSVYSEAVQLDTARRDASVLQTPFGSVTNRLVALVYSNGGHFITVGRGGCNGEGTTSFGWHVLGATTWWCWDGMPSGGRGEGQPLHVPPTGAIEEQLRSGSRCWLNYRPHLLIYCRTQPAPS